MVLWMNTGALVPHIYLRSLYRVYGTLDGTQTPIYPLYRVHYYSSRRHADVTERVHQTVVERCCANLCSTYYDTPFIIARDISVFF